MRGKEEAARQKKIEEQILGSGILIPEGERKRRELAQGFAPFTARRDPELEDYVMNLPSQIYYYNEEKLDERTRQLLFGSGTAPIYDDQTGDTLGYPSYMAPEYVSQLQHDVNKPNRYDYLSKWETMLV